MEYEELEKLSLQESKRQTKERRDRGKNMIRPFTFDEEKRVRDGLMKRKSDFQTHSLTERQAKRKKVCKITQ